MIIIKNEKNKKDMLKIGNIYFNLLLLEDVNIKNENDLYFIIIKYKKVKNPIFIVFKNELKRDLLYNEMECYIWQRKSR